MKRSILDSVQHARSEKTPVALVSDLEQRTQGLIYAGEKVSSGLQLEPAQISEIRSMLRAARSGMIEGDKFFVRSYVPAYRLLIVGAVHIAQALSALAIRSGYQVAVIDPRRAFATQDRFRDVALYTEWPDEAMAHLKPDAQTAVVTLAHDPKIDDPALITALASDAFYIGALGSRRTHSKRVERLTEQGLGEHMERINAPIGLNLGGRAHAEIAVAILAQLIQTRYSG